METARKLRDFSDVLCACSRFRNLLEDPRLELSDVQLGRLVKELRTLRCVVEELAADIPFGQLRHRLWEHADTLKELHKTPDLCIVDGDGNSLEGKEAKEYVEYELRQVNLLAAACGECGELP